MPLDEKYHTTNDYTDYVIENMIKEIDNRYNDSIDGDNSDDFDDGYREGLITAKEILTKHFTPKKQELVEITPKELEELREKARKYDELCK